MTAEFRNEQLSSIRHKITNFDKEVREEVNQPVIVEQPTQLITKSEPEQESKVKTALDSYD